MENLSTEDFLDNIESQIEAHVSKMKKASAKKFGLDVRCGNLWYNDNAIVVNSNNRSGLEFYGGFEYIDESDKKTFGDYIFYSSRDDRVFEALETVLESEV